MHVVTRLRPRFREFCLRAERRRVPKTICGFPYDFGYIFGPFLERVAVRPSTERLMT
jgi:hypothetical protein